MKWWVLVVFLLFPISVQAERPAIGADAVIIGEKWNTDRKPHFLQMFLAVNENGNYLRATIRVYVPKIYSLDAVKKGTCGLTVNNQLISDRRDFLIFGTKGRDIWFPSLMKRDRIGLRISWNDNPHVEYATVALEGNQGIYTEIFETARAAWYFRETSVSEQGSYYRDISLDEVCETFQTKDFN